MSGTRTRASRGRAAPAAPSATGPTCRHYWVIEPPNGPTASGVCELCGERREFLTSHDGFSHEDAGPPAPAR